ncbi:MAG: RnfABCDGE type electron transport complex subunit G [Kiritimatiellia bacterium]
MKTSFQLIGSLTIICVLSGALLAFVNGATYERIAAVAEIRTAAAAAKVLPPHETILDPVLLEHAGTTYRFLPAQTADGTLAGFAVAFATSAGYGGEIRMMLGIDPEGTTTGLVILPGHKETPGLGAKITETGFLARFSGKSLADTAWQVRKDGGEIDEITAATVSSRAVTDAIQAAATAFATHSATLTGRK